MRTNATLPNKPTKWSAQHRHVLQVMADLYNWRWVIEVGVWKGDTGVHLLETCPRLMWTGVDPYQIPEGSMDEPGYCNYGFVDMNAVYRTALDRVQPFGKRALLIRQPSVVAASGITPRTADAVFLDGDHREEHVAADIAAWRPAVKEGGWLMGHDFDMPPVRSVVLANFPGAIELPDRTWAIRL